MVLDVVLDTSDLSPNQVLVLADQRGKRLRVSAPARRPRQPAHDVYAGLTAAPGGRGSPVPRPRSAGAAPLGPRRPSSATAASSSGAPPTASVAPDVILERWVLSLSPRSTTTSTSTSSASFSPSSSTSYPSPSTAARPPPPAPPSTTTTTAIELPTVYKHAILHFRAQFTLARTLPAWALHRRLARRPFAAAAAGGTGLGLRVRMGRGEGYGGRAGEGEEREGEVGIEEALEGGEGETEKIVFPGIETPLGTLSLSVTYRLNTDFSVEEIETLLSSRFLDEDFFRPTVARYPTHVQQPQQQHPHQHSSHALRAEPGSLPLTSTSPGGGFALGIGTGGASRASPPVAAAPASTARGMTGLAPLPSYGSLSSRHPYAPHPLGPATTTPHAPSPLSSSPRPGNALPAPVAVPRASHASSQAASSPRPASYMSAGGASPTASHSSSAPRFVAYGPGHDAAPSPASAAAAPSTSTSAGAGAVEPAFISLARARGASYSGGGPGSSSVPRASPLSASPATQAGGFFRRASGGSSSSGAGGGAGAGGFYGAAGTSAGGGGGSPIFRAGSYLGTSALASSSSPSGAPIGRQQPLPLPVAVPAPAGAHPQLSGSPLAGGGGSMSVRPSGLGSYGSQGSYTRSGLMRASSASGGSGSFDEAHAHGHPHGHGSAIVRRPSGGAASRALSFGVAGSLGRSPGGGGGIGGAMASGGAAAGSSGVSRLGTMMAQYDAASSPGGAAAARAGAGPGAAGAPAPAAERRRFVHEGRAPDDADDIEAFLGMLDSKPDLRASDAGGGLGGGLGRSSVAAGGGGGFVSKRDVDEQLRLLRSSVYGSAGPGSAGSGGESASPPVLFGGSAGWAGPSGVSPSPRTSSGLSSLRRQTSRLSIEEDPAAEAAAVAARSPSRERLATGPERTPRAPLRTLYGHGHGRASPTLSATSGTSTAVPPLPQPSAAGVEPRFLPLPLSSTTSPLASPGTHGAHPHYRHHALQSAAFGAYPFAALAPQPYPPLPYPPAAEGSTADSPSSAPPDATTTTASEPVTIAPMRPSSAGAAARGGPSAVAYHQLRRGVGSTTQPTTPALGSEHTSAAASIASFDVDADGGAESSSSYRCEEEPVGRLELDDSEEQQHDAQLQLEAERRGRWGGGLGAEADEEEIARLHSHSGRAAPGRHSRDATPAATRLGGGGSGATAPATGYFARGAGGAAGSSPPEISWMG
ncbi:uncharacterized protein RHOBADRAFT_53973 [Rhodotorula graminis WP1]|uniref:Autophagy-related protein 13 n=1 Tax=Rhodotorula graminis (strain WP1) TaxID=578459 RepID=A0A194S6N6_RHOGW|nr:uncharacterized protein RHOBADRAFT_53973 [Rhodotorula graminis WP1]KPV75076.1 hypothetical protein RHOBADRAFT_53973 [Rhodotorula graminis WP1]